MKNVQQMNRTEVIKELARHAHPSWYHSLLDWETPQLMALLTYYQAGGRFPTEMMGRIYRTEGVGGAPMTVISIDYTRGWEGIGREIVRQLKIKRVN